MVELKIRAVLFQEEGWWVAQCLEHDIAAQARTRDDLLYELERILVGHFFISAEKGKIPFANLPRAPRRYWVMYEQAEPIPAEALSFRQGAFQVLPDVELRAA
jgi:predicted RNase H-like HicB family nuclease